ncbi:hypothetical protein DCC85_14570 [Paenibacillus sp. CAA11]|uniref:ImmA/IrrE family metallo-endopeptidase n=1 Tax=Paenibacillus sp. CAA11 TaxID=1532905 RepID=UPI000D39090A|nr:ImmA/IrrE family metallo-endopeptidase [Paenibacillus sp. CAA11]AWB45326.1 hypothetical protein DCC85_14570 [Paenibacillus sp. CAA11]
MDLTLYQETELEQSISSAYKKHGFLRPEDLDIDQVADAFEIDIVYYEGNPFSCNISYVIFLDKKMEPRQQREVFFHELCHVLRHAGNQKLMPRLFLEQQEIEADRFALYAAAPFFMIRELELPDHQKEAADMLAEEFKLPAALARSRIEQMQGRILQHVWQNETAKALNPSSNSVLSKSSWTEETQKLLDKLYHQLEGRES